MRIEWEVKINPNNEGTLFSSHNNTFGFYNEKLYHTYSDISRGVLVVLDIDISSGNFITRYIPDTENDKLVSARDIAYYNKGNELLLCTRNNTYNISKVKIRRMRKKASYNTEHIPAEYKQYRYENLLVRFPSARTIECIDTQTSQQLWKYSLKGYPYTEIEYINNHLFFGTAGKGGALYCIQLDNGEIKRDVSTRGTVNYCWHNGKIVTYTEKGNLQILDPYSNRQIDLLKLENQIGFSAPMTIIKNCLYTISFSRANKDIWPKPTYLVCINLLEEDITKH